MRAFVGVSVLMAIFNYSDIYDYWSNKWGFDPVRSVFTRARFEELNRFFHLVDNSQHPPSPTRDPFYKVQPLLDMFINCHLHIAAGRFITVDERLIPFKVRLHIFVFPPCCV
jgi:hypothetical protein